MTILMYFIFALITGLFLAFIEGKRFDGTSLFMCFIWPLTWFCLLLYLAAELGEHWRNK